MLVRFVFLGSSLKILLWANEYDHWLEKVPGVC